MAANSISIAELAAPETRSDELSERLRVATDLLEAVARDRGLLAELSAEERTRLLQVCGRVYCPEPAERRRLIKATQRRQKARRRQRDQAILAQSGIRELRSKPVFTTPNETPPVPFEENEDASAPREVIEAQCCYICKRDY